MNKINKLQTQLYFLFLALAVGLFLLLATKKPFGTNSLIGNFDPFPDSLHYIVPARNFALGNGFTFAREQGSVGIGVPPIYSLTLIPTYFINQDARSFHFSNLALGVISIVLLFAISRQLSKSVWVTGLLLFVYVISFVIYWQPSLAMAENVLLPVCLAVLWLFLQPLSMSKVVISAFLAIACYGSKYVSLPISAVFMLFLLGKIYLEEKNKSLAWRYALVAIIIALSSFLVLGGKQFLSYIPKLLQSDLSNSAATHADTRWLSFEYLSKSLPQYSSALFGAPIYNLWHTKAILPQGMAALVLGWCVWAIFRLPKQRFFAALLVSLILGQLAFLSMIEMIEGRYAFVFIPIIFTGAAAMAGQLIDWGERKISKQKNTILQIATVTLLALASLMMNFQDLKTQLLLNFKGGEMPWWQVGVQEADRFIQQINTDQAQEPIVISSLSPFVWDFYRQARYQVLPLSSSQSMVQETIWGVDLPSDDLSAYYKNELAKGRVIYLATVGFGRADWPFLDVYRAEGMQLELLEENCAGACKIYQLNTEQNN
jgi:hypothetical protein